MELLKKHVAPEHMGVFLEEVRALYEIQEMDTSPVPNAKSNEVSASNFPPLEELLKQLPTRLRNAIKNEMCYPIQARGIKFTTEMLLQYEWRELRGLTGVGNKSIREMRDLLAKYNLAMQGEFKESWLK